MLAHGFPFAGQEGCECIYVFRHLIKADFAIELFSVDVISVKRPIDAPPILAFLIQDDLVSRVNNEIKGVKEFIRRMPEGSRVMTGYITAGSLSVAQDFTIDVARAADSLRVVRGGESAAPFNPSVEVVEALRRFDKQPAGRRMALLVLDGLDVSRGFRSASPFQSLDLEQAISEAQRCGVAING